MIEIIEAVLPYIKGLWTLPWIIVGFIVTVLLSYFINEQKIDKAMKRIGLILLYIFVPLLLFRIFLGVDFGEEELVFAGVCFLILFFMYIIAYFFAISKAKKMTLDGIDKRNFVKTVLTNQGRSSAFVGGAMLAIPGWWVLAAIYMSIGAIFLFAIVPYILSYLHKKDIEKPDVLSKVKTLPWYLKLFPWYLLIFAFSSILIHSITGLTTKDFGDTGTFFEFFTSLTIPAALYYVGAGIHPRDLKSGELKKIFSLKKHKKEGDSWRWIRNIFFLTAVVTPLLTVLFFSVFLVLNLIPKQWFAVIVINSVLPITSTNMFLVPYGIDKKVTAHSVTWTTIFCVPIVVFLIYFFTIILGFG